MSNHGLDISKLVCLGINHHSAPVELRERIGQLLEHDWEPASGTATEWAILSTCNRFELYLLLDPTVNPELEVLQQSLESDAGFIRGELTHHLYAHYGMDAARHLAIVASGLDSLILGETEIQRQVVDAYRAGTERNSIGPVLNRVFLAGIRAGKRARATTAISTRPASISSVAISHVEAMIGGLKEHDFLVVGLGEMGQSTVRGLIRRGVQRVAVSNRTDTRAEALRPLGVEVYSFADLGGALAEADVVFTATASRTPVITEQIVQQALCRRAQGIKVGSPLLFIDIAVPRDVAASVGEWPNIRLIDIDHLRISLDSALESRRQAIPQVSAIIDGVLVELEADLRQLVARPLVADLRQQAEEIRARQVERSLQLMGDIEPSTAHHIELMSRALVNKLLHEPTLQLKKAADDERLPDYEETVRTLFGLQNGQHGDS